MGQQTRSVQKLTAVVPVLVTSGVDGDPPFPFD